jgi:hypothetical protein
MDTKDWIYRFLRENTKAGFILGLLLVSVYSHYKTSVKLTRVCENIVAAEQSHWLDARKSNYQKEITSIVNVCHDRLDRLSN